MKRTLIIAILALVSFSIHAQMEQIEEKILTTLDNQSTDPIAIVGPVVVVDSFIRVGADGEVISKFVFEY